MALFSINSATGAFRVFISAPNYEAPTDANADNVYDVTVQVSDGANTDSQALAVTVTNVNETPTVTSSATASVAENTTAVMTVTASDPDAATTFTYAIAGGADAAKFNINSATGALTFATAPDYESPTDVGADNVYNVTVQVSGSARSPPTRPSPSPSPMSMKHPRSPGLPAHPSPRTPPPS